MSLRNWFLARRVRRLSEARCRGYDWAAGSLLRGESIESVDARIYTTTGESAGSCEREFDRGALDALIAWERLK